MKQIKKEDRVVEHNDLINSMNKMNKLPLKIFEMVVSAIDPQNPPENNTIVLSKQKIFDAFEVKSENKSTRFKNSIELLHRQSVFKIREGVQRGKVIYQVISPFSSTQWDLDGDRVVFKLTEEIMPYLVDLRANFTQLALSEMLKLNSKYSIILYKWLTMHLRQYEQYAPTKERTQEQLDKLLNPTISVDDFRIFTDTVDSYKRFSELERKTLAIATKELNEKTDLHVEYETRKRGRKVSLIIFHLDKSYVAKNLTYKEEENDEPAKLSQEEKNKIATDAMQSEFTATLVKCGILNALQVIDKDLMYHIAKRVFPIYDQMRIAYGKKTVHEHISYVSEYMVDYSNKNLPKYLATAAKDYLTKLNNKA